MNIRRADMSDIPDLLAMIRRVIAHMRSQSIDQWDELYPAESTLVEDVEARSLFVAEAGEACFAMFSMDERQSPEWAALPWSMSGPAVALHRLSVDPDHRRRGIASRLMDFAERQAATGGYEVLRLDAFTENSGATALYEGRGYKKVGTVQFRKGLFMCYEKGLSREG